MCEGCRKLKTASRRTPPHAALVLEASQPFSGAGMTADERYYRCATCGHPWLHETGNAGYGWSSQAGRA